MAWSPLAGGKIFNPETSKEKELVAFMRTLVAKYNVNSIDQIAMAWLLKHPAKAQIIIGSQNISRLENTVRSQEIDLDIQDWFKILEISNGYEAP